MDTPRYLTLDSKKRLEAIDIHKISEDDYVREVVCAYSFMLKDIMECYARDTWKLANIKDYREEYEAKKKRVQEELSKAKTSVEVETKVLERTVQEEEEEKVDPKTAKKNDKEMEIISSDQKESKPSQFKKERKMTVTFPDIDDCVL